VGEFDLKSSFWSKVSADLKDLIKNMLEVDPVRRFSAQEAVNHKFFKNKA
jgi:serine/threonine protein kinase